MEVIDLVVRVVEAPNNKSSRKGPLKVPLDAVSKKSKKIRIFIRTILTSFYPEIGFGLQFEQFLSGRRIWHLLLLLKLNFKLLLLVFRYFLFSGKHFDGL